jgi:hypothetical protein
MQLRHFSWRDLSYLRRYRQETVYLDSALLFTRGALQLQGALFSFIAPNLGVVTLVTHDRNNSQSPVIGQAIRMNNSQSAHLTFLTPEHALGSAGCSVLLEELIRESGKRGALRLIADVEEEGKAFESLRRDNFAIFCRQRIWRFPTSRRFEGNQFFQWRRTQDADLVSIRALYNDLVPGLVRQVEPFSTQIQNSRVVYDGEGLIAYAEIRSGRRGIWIQPLVHPGMDETGLLFEDLFRELGGSGAKPIHICVRSYQSWLEPKLETLDAEASPRQAVMVKQLAVAQKVDQPIKIRSLERRTPEVTAPITQTENNEFSNRTA